MHNEIIKAFIKAYHIKEDEYEEIDGKITFKDDYKLIKCNIFGMGWILGREKDYLADKKFFKEMQNKALQSGQ